MVREIASVGTRLGSGTVRAHCARFDDGVGERNFQSSYMSQRLDQERDESVELHAIQAFIDLKNILAVVSVEWGK